MSDPWNPTQYERFERERSQPFRELLALIRPRPGMRAVDLGCGTGELTLQLHRELACASMLGLDSSAAMLERVPQDTGLSFAQGDVASFEGRYDLIFSHAALQWLDGHPELFARLTACLEPGGQLAVQVPANFDHVAHLEASRLAAEEPFDSALRGYRRQVSVLAPEDYSCLLFRLGYREQHVRLQVFLHTLETRDEVLEWVKGTLLTDYQRRLPPEVFAGFLEEYRARLRAVLPDEQPFLYPFKRILLWAQL